jgi:N-formylglutamate amidohydrolase
MTALPWTATSGDGPIVATAIHAGHDLRPEVLALTALSDADRRREEDPFTDQWLGVGDATFDVARSRFEVDLNRPRDAAVYRVPADAWGLELWRDALPDDVVEDSLGIYDDFYRELEVVCDRAAEDGGRFVVMDLHSYNHRREGPDAPVDDPAENPEINVGTGSVEDALWRPVIDAFSSTLARHPFDGGTLDVRENVRFRGGHMSRWINERYAGRGCALAIEIKKIYMNEWTGEPDELVIASISDALHAATQAVRSELA